MTRHLGMPTISQSYGVPIFWQRVEDAERFGGLFPKIITDFLNPWALAIQQKFRNERKPSLYPIRQRFDIFDESYNIRFNNSQDNRNELVGNFCLRGNF